MFAAMNASKLAGLGQRYFVVLCGCLIGLTLCGCASYFRTRGLSPDELNQKNQEQQQLEQQRLFEPDPNFNR